LPASWPIASCLDCRAAADRYDFATRVQRTPSGLLRQRSFDAAPVVTRLRRQSRST
jgi:hypothetical protein